MALPPDDFCFINDVLPRFHFLKSLNSSPLQDNHYPTMKRPIERLPAATSSATRLRARDEPVVRLRCAGRFLDRQLAGRPPAGPGLRTSLFPSNVPAELHDQTVRQLARISLGGTRVRIVLANTYGSARSGSANLAKPGSERAAVPPAACMT